MRYYFYDTYGKDIVAHAYDLSQKFTDVILNNYIPPAAVIDILKGYGLNVWIATKLYDGSYELDIPRILKLGAGLALDAEPYNDSGIWKSDISTVEITDALKILIPADTEVLIMPERMSSDKYKFYNLFLNVMTIYYDVTLILELTYGRVWPWEINSCLNNFDGKKIIGIWPSKAGKILGIVQRLFTQMMGDVMFYSEERDEWKEYA